MPRESEEKLINDEEKYSKLLPRYKKLLDRLSKRYNLSEQKEFRNLVNFHTNRYAPKHNWFEYKQGYSEDLVKRIMAEVGPSKNHYVLDPFTGVGTTNLVAQELGFKSIGLDINPVAAFAAKVKTTHYSQNKIEQIKKLIQTFSPKTKSSSVPISPLLEHSFSKDVFEQLMHIKGFYESLEDKDVSNFFKLAYLSIIEACSNRVKDGNGIKIAKNKKKVRDVYAYYIDKCKAMFTDITKLNVGQETIIIGGSILQTEDFERIKNKIISLVVFSPPYANCFDYCEVYKLELWMGGFVSSYADFSKYRSIALRSHVNSKFDHAIKNKNESTALISEMVSCFNIWNKNIPDMIKGYFDDMTETFKRLKQVMATGSKCYIVVANSGYKGVLVPTDLILSEIAEEIGFKVNEIIFARKIRASSQQMRELHNKYNNLMRESIIVFEKT